MLVHIGKLINRHMLGKYAVPAFNTQDLETTLGIVRAAQAQKAPIIIQTSVGALEYAGIEELVGYAHKRGVWVQAELGRILGNEDWQNVKSGEDLMTDPDQAADFVAQTRIDTLAVAVGSMHGIPIDPRIKKVLTTLREHIDLKRLAAIRQKVKIPLVVHGASGVPDAQLRAAIKFNVAVFNIDTDLRVAFNKALRANLKKNPQIYDPRKLLAPATDALQKVAEHKLRVLKTSNQI